LYEGGTKDIPLGKVLAVLVDDKDDIAAFANYAPDAGASPAAEPKAAAAATPSAAATPAPVAAPSTPAAPSGGRIFASPLA